MWVMSVITVAPQSPETITSTRAQGHQTRNYAFAYFLFEYSTNIITQVAAELNI